MESYTKDLINILVILCVVTTVQAGCDPGWYEFGNKCYYISSHRQNYQNTLKVCASKNSTIWIPKGQNETTWIFKIFDNGYRIMYWTGLRVVNRRWTWSDGTGYNKNNLKWYRNQEGSTTSPNCGGIYGYAPYTGQYQARRCTDGWGVVCTKSNDQLDLCDRNDGWMQTRGRCLKFFNTPMSWQSARRVCQDNRGDLTVFKDNDQLAELGDLVKCNIPENMLWIGISDTANPRHWQWINNDTVRYSRWVTQRFVINGSTCVVSDPTSGFGWRAYTCDSQFKFVCNRTIGHCPQGWLSNRDRCYQPNVVQSSQKTWFDAKKFCDSMGTRLLVIDSLQEQQFIASTMGTLKIDRAWLAFSDALKSDELRWINGQLVLNATGYQHWDTNFPQLVKQRFDCGLLTRGTSDAKWSNAYCFNQVPFFCQMKITTKPVAQPTQQPATGHCKPGWKYFNSKCYYFGPQGNQTLKSWGESLQYCTSSGLSYHGNLVVINDPYEMSFVTVQQSSILTAWIGLKYDDGMQKLVWVDHSLPGQNMINETNFYPGEPDDIRNGQECIQIVGGRTDFTGSWDDGNCSLAQGFVCEMDSYPGASPPPTTAMAPNTYSDLCGPNWVYSAVDNICYQVVINEPKTWAAAQSDCQARGGDLASISGHKEQNFIQGMLSSLVPGGLQVSVWIGATDRTTEGGWHWVDNAPFRYLNWHPSEPNNSPVGGLQEDCAEMVPSWNYQWNDKTCNAERMYICKKNAIMPTSTLPPGATVNPMSVDCPGVPMISGNYSVVEDSVFASTHARDSRHQKFNSRLYPGSQGAWSAKVSDQNQYISVRFFSTIVVKGIITAGRENNDEWVSQYKIQYKDTYFAEYLTYQDPPGTDKVLIGNTDASTPVTNMLLFPFEAIEVKLIPVQWHSGISLRWEVLGCIEESCSPEYAVSGPVIAKDTSITASTEADNQHKATSSRLHTVYAASVAACWRPTIMDTNQWIQVKLEMVLNVRGITIRGNPNDQEWVTSYRLKYSFRTNDTLKYYQEPYNKIMTIPGNTDNVSPSTYMLKAHLQALNIRIIPYTWNQAIAISFDVLVCAKGCKGLPLITGPKGPKISDDKITASTSINDRHSPARARLNLPSHGSYGGAWIPQFSDPAKYLQVDLGFMVYIQAISTQGAYDTNDWVTNYTLRYSGDGLKWTDYFAFGRSPVVFEGNLDQNSVRKHYLLLPFITRYVRLIPSGFHNMVAVRLEIYGCPGSDSGLQIGCYADVSNKRDLSFEPLTDSRVGMWPPMCINHCFRNGYFYAGLQNQYECYCGNTYGMYGPASDCNLKCVPQDNFKCGGPSSNMIYTTGLTPQFKVCPKNWKPYNDRCYILLLDKRSWYDARADCQRVGADLASPDGQPEQDFVYSLIQYGNGSNAWIGFNDMQNEGLFVWSDGRQVKYTNWGLNQPNHISHDGQDCVFMNATTAGWQDLSCDASNMYVCQMDKRSSDRPPPVTQSPRGCRPGWQAYMSSCYTMVNAPKTWNNANRACLSLGGWLVMINDKSEQSYVSSMLASKSQTFWSAVNDNRQHGTFVNLQQSGYLLYTNWARDNPSPLGHCVYMGTGSVAGMWFTGNCSSTMGMVCETNRVGFTTARPPPRTTVLAQCDAGTVQTNTSCYEVNIQQRNQQLTWQEAVLDCAVKGAYLASFHSAAELDFVWRHSLVGTSTNFWIGLNDQAVEGGYRWSDKSIANYFNWDTNEPNSYHGSENCVEMKMSSGKWNDRACYSRMNWICMVKRGGHFSHMVTLPYPRGQISTQCGTDQSWTLYHNFCYFANDGNGDHGLSWRQARQACKLAGAELVSVSSVTEQLFIYKSLLRNISASYVWTGFNELDYDRGYRWSDGAQVVFTNWARGEPNDFGGAEDCVHMAVRNGLWNDEHCAHQFGYVCKKRLGSSPTPPVPTIPGPGNCPTGFSQFKSKCFMIINVAVNWTTAFNNCKSAGYTLASIHDDVENAFLTTLLGTVTLSPWIGLSKQTKNQMTWISNDDVTYTNFAFSEPNGGMQERCIQMLGFAPKAGQWNDVSCSSAQGYICQTKKDPSLTTPEPVPSICDTRQNQKQFKDACYFYMPQPLTWQAADDQCVKQGGGYLTSINSVYEQAFIYVMMMQNNAQHLWTGLNDIKVQGSYSWKDGWPVLYTNWDAGEPVRGAGEGCVMFNTTGRWIDTNCNATYPYVCKVSTATPPMSPPPPDGRCPYGWYPHVSKCYYLSLNLPMSAIDASFYCQRQHGTLVSIHNASENAYLVSTIRGLAHSGQSFWTSLHKSLDSGFQWLDGTPLQYTNWRPGEPSVRGWAGNNENCAEVFVSDGKWNDEDCNSKRLFVCETKQVIDGVSLPPGSAPPIAARSPSTLPTQLVPTLSKRPNSGQQTPYNPFNSPPTRHIIGPTHQGPTHGGGSMTTKSPPGSLPPFNTNSSNSQSNAQRSVSTVIEGLGMTPGALAGTIVGFIVVLVAVAVGLLYWRKKTAQGAQAKFGLDSGFENKSYMTAHYDGTDGDSEVTLGAVGETDS